MQLQTKQLCSQIRSSSDDNSGGQVWFSSYYIIITKPEHANCILQYHQILMVFITSWK